jgi:hypothetical protein
MKDIIDTLKIKGATRRQKVDIRFILKLKYGVRQQMTSARV